MKVRTMTLAGVALVAVVALGVLGTLRWASAIGSDVNNDGTVNIIDIGHIVRDFGQTVPTEPLEVLEQNLDESGNIKVHEQGVVDVNILTAPTAGMRELLMETVVGDNSTTSLVDTSDCTDFIGMLRPTAGTMTFAGSGTIDIDTSPDGFTWIKSRITGTRSNDGGEGSTVLFSAALPYVSLRVVGGVGGTADVWLFCS